MWFRVQGLDPKLEFSAMRLVVVSALVSEKTSGPFRVYTF